MQFPLTKKDIRNIKIDVNANPARRLAPPSSGLGFFVLGLRKTSPRVMMPAKRDGRQTRLRAAFFGISARGRARSGLGARLTPSARGP
jgi:hypothetical protein